MKKNQIPFERKSRCNHKNKSFLDENFNYVYTYEETLNNGEIVTKKIEIPYSEENHEIFILLDSEDHAEALASRYNDEMTDKIIEYRKDGNAGSDADDMDDPMELIPDKDVFNDDEDMICDNRIKEIQEWMKTLPESQLDLIYKHLGEGMFLEEIRRQEEMETGRAITKQAMHNRWKKIMNKAYKHFGIEPPKQQHNKG